MTSNTNPFRKTKFRAHATPRLYFDADYVKPLVGDKLFHDEDTLLWHRASIGAVSVRHPRRGYNADPLCVMLVVDALMKVDVHSKITAVELAALMNRLYDDYVWEKKQVGRMLRHIYHSQEKSGAPTFGKWKALNAFGGDEMWHYSLYPDRETYIWLAKIRMRLEMLMRAVTRKERRYGTRARFGPGWDGSILWDKEFKGDTRDVPITEGIVFKEI